GNQITEYWDAAKGWFTFWPHSPGLDNDSLAAVQTGVAQAEVEGWPAPRIYALDEAGAHNLLDEAIYYYGLLRWRLPGVSSYTTIGGGTAMGFDEIGKLAPVVDFLTTNRFTP